MGILIFLVSVGAALIDPITAGLNIVVGVFARKWANVLAGAGIVAIALIFLVSAFNNKTPSFLHVATMLSASFIWAAATFWIKQSRRSKTPPSPPNSEERAQ